jgi:hypothetical protein
VTTARFGFPYIAADQAQKHVTHNAALDTIDAAIGGLVASATTTTAPASPGEGDAYIVPAGASGFGGVAAGAVAVYAGGAWTPSPPFFGRRAYALDEGRGYVYGGAAFGWVRGDLAGGLTGASLGLVIREATLNLASGTSQTAPGLIPTGSIVLGVSSKTVLAITGASSYMVGLSAGASEFGSGLGLAVGSTNLGMVGPFAVYANTGVVVTRAGGAFTGGRVRLAAMLLCSAMPTAV